LSKYDLSKHDLTKLESQRILLPLLHSDSKCIFLTASHFKIAARAPHTDRAMSKFIGRSSELQVLETAFASGRSEFIPVYGRRRVGKSELILKFMKGKPGVYYLGGQSPSGLQVREFLVEAARALNMPLLAELGISDWRKALTTVVDQWMLTQPNSKLVLALDEFQWIAGSEPGLVADLQHLWDRHWKTGGSVLLMLCGSYIGFMEREVLGQSSPLFGRRTAQIHLHPFGYLEAAEFHSNWSLIDRARAYFLVGGLPQYLLCLNDRLSVESNIRQNLLDQYAPLFHEPTFLLREELREIAPYRAILFAIASGRSTVKAIAEATSLPDRNLHYYLQQLADLGYVRRRYPLDGQRANPKQLRFGIRDPLLRFWFRFVFPNASIIRSAGPSRAFTERIAPSLDAWFGNGFEHLCREALPLIYAHEGVAAGFEIGEYWSAKTQIDTIGLRDDHWTDLGECKWGTVRSPGALEAELDRKMEWFPNNRGATLGRRYFVRRRPAGRKEAANWYGLDDLYSLKVDG